jgi:uroporphyrinogen-III synthase
MIEIAPPDVILLRSADDPDPYVHAFGEAGLRAVCRPVLTFVFPNDGSLRDRLRQRGQYGGIVATSPRAGRALRRVFDSDGTIHAEWEEAPAFVVGPKTAERFRALGLDVQGAHTGSADALASWIADAGPEQPLLFLSGNRRRETLPEGLREAGVAFDEQVVYETHTRGDLSLPSGAGGAWLVFFSPSGLDAVQASGCPIDTYRCAAIGSTTAAALEEEGLSVRAVADAPSPQGLVSAIRGAGT